MVNVRGAIRNDIYARTLNDYSGLLYGKITPTDIDGFIDFQNRAFVVIEMKYADAKMPYGQRLALERLTDAIHSTGRPCACFVAQHYGGQMVDAARCQVTEFRFNKKWFAGDGSTLRQMIDRFYDKFL